MEILDKKLQKKVKVASKKLGLLERDVVNQAVATYLETISGFVNLKKELDMWDMLTAQTVRKYKF